MNSDPPSTWIAWTVTGIVQDVNLATANFDRLLHHWRVVIAMDLHATCAAVVNNLV